MLGEQLSALAASENEDVKMFRHGGLLFPVTGARRDCRAELCFNLVQIDFTSPPSMRSVAPVIQRAPDDTRKAINSAISSGSP